MTARTLLGPLFVFGLLVACTSGIVAAGAWLSTLDTGAQGVVAAGMTGMALGWLAASGYRHNARIERTQGRLARAERCQRVLAEVFAKKQLSDELLAGLVARAPGWSDQRCALETTGARALHVDHLRNPP